MTQKTKLLHDGTEVPLNTPTHCINGKRYLMTEQQIAEKKIRDTERQKQNDIAKLKLELNNVGKQMEHMLEHGIAGLAQRQTNLKQQIQTLEKS